MSKNGFARLMAEPLESRLALAGNVLAAVSGSNLNITGDDLDNSIIITQLNDTQVRILGVGTTTIGGAAFQDVTFNGGNLHLRMRGAADVVQVGDFIRDINFRYVSVDGGAGADTVAFNRVNVTDGGSAYITLGSYSEVDADSFTAINSNFSGYLSLQTGGGGDTVNLGDGGNLVGIRSLYLDTGAGSDNVTTNFINLTGGNTSTFRLGGSEFEFDQLTMTNTSSQGYLNLYTGGGGDIITLNGLSVQSSLNLDAGSGDDSIQSNTSLFTAGNAYFNLGDGGNDMDIIGVFQVNGNLTVYGQNLVDTVTINATSTIQGDANFYLGGGDNRLEIDGSFDLGDDFYASFYNGNDTLTADGLDADRFDVNLGSGTNNVTLSNLDLTSSFNIYGGYDADTLDIDNVITTAAYFSLSGGFNTLDINGLSRGLGQRTQLTIYSGYAGSDIDLTNILVDRFYAGLGAGTNTVDITSLSANNVTLYGGWQDDSFSFNGLLTNSLYMTLGTGTNSLTATNANVTGRATVYGGLSEDTVSISSATIFDAYMSLIFGDDDVTLTNVTLTDRVYLNGGLGTNTLTQTGVTLPPPDRVTILNFI